MKSDFKQRLVLYKKNSILFILVLTIITIFLSAVLSSCCVDLSKFLEPKSEEITFEGNKENADQIDELLEEYDIDPEDFINSIEKQYQDIDYTAVKKELADASGYSVTAEEEEQFFGSLEKIYSEERFIMARDYLENFKNLYPSGYFTLVKVTQKDDYGMFELMEENKDTMSSSIDKFLEPDFNSSYSGDINTILHELTHIGPSAFFSILMEKGLQAKYGSEYYMIGNLIILIEKDKMLFSKTEVFQDIENPDDYDVLYLSPYEFNSNEIDLINILDELNTYTGGVKCGVASESLISYGHSRSLRWGLLKQMSHLELYLKRCYEKYPEDWEYITEHKGLAFMVMKLWQEAEKFENIVKDDSRFNMDSEPVSEFVYNPNNYKIIEKFFDDSEIMSYRDETFPQACEELDGIKIYDINS